MSATVTWRCAAVVFVLVCSAIRPTYAGEAIVRRFPIFTLSSSPYLSVAQIDVPDGFWVVNAQAWFNNTVTTADTVECKFTIAAQPGLAHSPGIFDLSLNAFHQPGQAIPVASTTVVDGPERVFWECRNSHGTAGAIDVRDTSLIAIQVDSLSFVP
jgi:hypothetical protein